MPSPFHIVNGSKKSFAHAHGSLRRKYAPPLSSRVVMPVWTRGGKNTQFLDAQKIDYVAHDGEAYSTGDTNDIYDFVKRQGRFIATQRTDGVSTTGLINRIVRRYNEFVLRNLNRGVDRKELNVSWGRLKRIEVTKAIADKKDQTIDKLGEWRKDPSMFVQDFLNVFGPKGKIVNTVKENVDQMKKDFVEYAQFAPM